jgi:hypothetical protein
MNQSTSTSTLQTNESAVLRLADVDATSISRILSRYGLSLKVIDEGQDIPGSYWGDSEAGLIANELLVRADTPLHSILHEACHYICLDKNRRAGIDTDASGDYDEENAVCYLQILLSAHIDSIGQHRMFRDMDNWGYTFRLGSAQSWFEEDAEDALAWLKQRNLVDSTQVPTFTLNLD